MSSALSYNEEVVPIEKLKEDEEFKSLVPPNNMKEQLTSSIVKNGQTLPIDVDSDYVILDGYTRVSILRELKYKEVKVRKWNFRSKENRATAYRLIAMLNLQRRHLEKNEVLRLLREIVEKIQKAAEVIERNKTEIKSEERQNYGPFGPYFAQNNEINTKPVDLELKMKQVKEEIGAKEVTDSDIKKYSIISTIPFLRQLVDDGKIPLRTAYELYTKAKDKLQKIANLPKYERDQLLTTREGRKIILERDDLLDLILQHKMAVSQAINKIKTEEKLQRSKNRSRAKDEEDLDESDEEELSETEKGHREDSESDEDYPLLQEWQRVKEEEEEKEKQLTPQLNVNTQVVTQFNEKGFFEIPERSVIARIGARLYVINENALRDLEQGKSERWKELVNLLSKADLVIPDSHMVYNTLS
ncbi:chromosome partitioning protein ParB [Sulfolobus islandicus]|uniref:ParB domain protein nuclease n=1 Tax=Saccharolobus islandicus (strain HVE10/4) TaxID=930943 RepID=F0NK03_SACI0|nr:ParB N-terminal domain-containing protein [Sulfolobus islandicus]ADX82319.1 ParB domain protein nuclease [Sulfolobus islandicus HVE10/4]WCM36368.1 chromosome partitioning protein ParB [Sulfolobus islandicus]